MSERTLIISDTHMGRPYASAGSAHLLRDLWQGCDHLIVNGDVVELHHPTYGHEAQEQLLQLGKLCEQDGVKLHLLAGNHDPFVSEKRYMLLDDGNVFVMHGDALHPAIAPWSVDAQSIHNAYIDAFGKVHPANVDDLHEILRVSQVAAYSAWMPENFRQRHGGLVEVMRRPWIIPRILHYWSVIPNLAARFCKRHAPDARFFIYGHTHRQGIRDIQGVHVINTGCYGFPGRPLGVVIDDGHLSVFNIHMRHGRYALASKPRRVYDLATGGVLS